ncbi:hypothetical protein NQ315_002520 [Exocentrus adspersus]|uniref:DUF4817 domain-containing protein n=1 Tax=Exocentrus adspersus TaxID=1586481 RepID=A0AAV8VLS2_9CUCU|nr:hypothetical protein NQ315_002520 [Exocentrus adspersus]
MVYTIAERVEVIFIYGAQQNCAGATARMFNDRHTDKRMDHSYVRALVEATGSVKNQKRQGDRVVDEVRQMEVIGQFVLNPTSSLRQMSALTGLSYSSVRKVTKLHKFHPYKMQNVQELSEDDFDLRIEFCERMTDMIIQNLILIQNIYFSDECTFFFNGYVNKHNVRYRSNENPHICRETHTQAPLECMGGHSW